MRANVIKTGHLLKANQLKPLINFKKVMGSIKTPAATDLISELPNTHQCFQCGKQVKLSAYVAFQGVRFCGIDCADIAAQRNPKENEQDVDLVEWED